MQWNTDWFTKTKKSHRYWLQHENQKKFLEEFARIHNIKSPEEWGRISCQMIKNRPGGESIMWIYKGSLFRLLRFVFPSI